MKRIVIPDDHPAVMSPSLAFRKLSGYDVTVHADRPGPVQLVERLKGMDAAINIRAATRFTREVLASVPELRAISIWGAGTDNVDLDAARSLGICVMNTPGVNARAVAEHTLMLILAVAKRLVDVDRQVRAGQWPRAMVVELEGRTLGLIGTGAIGSKVGRMANALGVRVLAWTYRPTPEKAAAAGCEWVGLDELMERSDIVSIHVRQSPESTGLVDSRRLALMKRGAMLINTARGAIVNEAALVEALRSQHLGGAGLDVFEQEPLPPDSPLRSLDNVILTPHSAGVTPETTEAGLAMAVENLFKFWSGHPQNVVA